MPPAPYLNVPLLASEAEDIQDQKNKEAFNILIRCEGLAYQLYEDVGEYGYPHETDIKFLTELETTLAKLIKSVHHNLR